MEITIQNLQKKIPLNFSQLKKIILKILAEKKIKLADLSVVFVSAQKIAALNKKYLHRSYATDVLAFDFLEEKASNKKNQICGEVIISTDAVIKNSKEFNTHIDAELALYVIHGILHLLGYDDHLPKDIQQMRLEEKRLLALIQRSIHSLISKPQ